MLKRRRWVPAAFMNGFLSYSRINACHFACSPRRSCIITRVMGSSVVIRISLIERLYSFQRFLRRLLFASFFGGFPFSPVSTFHRRHDSRIACKSALKGGGGGGGDRFPVNAHVPRDVNAYRRVLLRASVGKRLTWAHNLANIHSSQHVLITVSTNRYLQRVPTLAQTTSRALFHLWASEVFLL
jgi:hypothetical protein